MKGIICAGGEGTRMQELCRVTNKHLVPVGPWPMIYYPLKTLADAGITDILLITGSSHAGNFIDILGDGRVKKRFSDELLFDLNLTYKIQNEALGIAQALSLAKDFILPEEKFVVILGDNLYQNSIKEHVEYYSKLPHNKSLVLLKEVSDPERFGVPKFNKENQIVEIIEKPGILNDSPIPSNFAVTGVYMFDSNVFDIITKVKPSARGELEITDVNNCYIAQSNLEYRIIDGWWRDVGKVEILPEVSRLVFDTYNFG